MLISRSQRGLSLVELMVGMTIALVAVAASTSMYVATKTTSRIQSSQARLAEDGRFAIFMLQRIIGQAGYRPPDGTLKIQPLIADYLTPDATNAVSKLKVKFTGDTVSSIDCTGAPVSGAQGLTISGSGGALTCTNEANVVTNWIVASSSGTGNATELVDFQLRYGTDRWGTAGSGVVVPLSIGCGNDSGSGKERDCVADTYDESVAKANASKIVSVKACLVLKAEATDGRIAKSAAVKNCSGNDVTNSQNDGKLYRTFRTTILLRNR